MLMGIVLVIAAFALLTAVWLAAWVLKKDRGTDAVEAISNAIQEGAEAFLARQNMTISVLAVVLAVVIFILYGFVRSHHAADPVASPPSMSCLCTLTLQLRL